ncbi:MAG TPA: hypothetical protein VG298_04215 [Acidimicrobiales bacterium]|nr:hypothetical protein [Acidimicrobiales bacterium]
MAALGVLGMGSFALNVVGVVSAGAAVSSVEKAKATKHPKRKPKPATASGCSSFHPGSKGVIQTFCTGKGVIQLTVGAVTTTIKGGTCAISGGSFTVNAGVVTSSAFKGTKPNYFGLAAQGGGAATFTNAVLAYTAGGVGGAVTKNTGTIAANHKSGTFTGTDLEGAAVSGSFTC